MEISRTKRVIPKDMIYETLYRCSSIQKLDKCKAVSKEWKDIIHDHGFMKDYYERDDNVYGYLMEEMLRNKHYHQFVSMNKSDRKLFTFSGNKESNLPGRFDDLQIEASSLQGIVCCLTRYCKENRFYVCKPTTGQWQKLPNPKFRYFGYDVGMAVLGSKPLHFVIIRLSYSNSLQYPVCSNYICELFDSKTWRWKQLKDLVLPFGSGLLGRAVYASGLICWLTSDKTVIAFSTDGKSRYVYQLPAEITDDDCGFHFREKIIEYQGKLGLIRQAYSELYMELWLFEGRKNECRWEKMMCVDLESSSTGLANHAKLAQFYSSEVALVMEVFSAMFFKLRDGSYDDVVKIKALAPELFVFRSDFEPVDFKGATRNHAS